MVITLSLLPQKAAGQLNTLVNFESALPRLGGQFSVGVNTPEGQKALGQHQMQPGMPVEVVFRTGERSLLTYLLHPLSKRLAASMKEE
jgi:hypothetical protein